MKEEFKSKRAPGADGRQTISTGCRQAFRLVKIISREGRKRHENSNKLRNPDKSYKFRRRITENAVGKSLIL